MKAAWLREKPDAVISGYQHRNALGVCLFFRFKAFMLLPFWYQQNGWLFDVWVCLVDEWFEILNL